MQNVRGHLKLSLKKFLKTIYAHFISTIFPSRLARDQTFFGLWERKGFHITPISFEEPIPDTRTLKDDIWRAQSELIGIKMDVQGQIELLSRFSSRFKEEYDRFPRNKTLIPSQYYTNNGAFAYVDSEILYCMIRYLKPKRIIEIGSGNSTYLSAQAILKNKEDNIVCQLEAIEPHPNDVLKAGFPGLSNLIVKNVQDVPVSEFSKLKNTDILFIDSSHCLKIGSDVEYEILEILPRLNKGVVVHFHDIFLPKEYPKKWVMDGFRFLNEQYMLQAFLTFNDSFEVLWASSYMALCYPDKLESAFNSYKRNFQIPPGSFWIRKTK